MLEDVKYHDKPLPIKQTIEFEAVLKFGFRPVPEPLTENRRYCTFEGMMRDIKSMSRHTLGRRRCTNAQYRVLLTEHGQDLCNKDPHVKQRHADLKIGQFQPL